MTDWKLIRNEYEDGASLRALAAKHGVSKSAIGKHKFSEQWTERVDRAASGHPRVDTKPAQALPISTHEKGPMTEVQRAAAQVAFLHAYAQQANVMVAAKAAGVHRTTVYDWLEKDEEFSFAYNQAKEDARDVLRAEIFRRAHDGWDEPVYQLGVFAGTVRKYDTTLLIFHAKMLMPEYREKSTVDLNARVSGSITQVRKLHALSDEELDVLERLAAKALEGESHGN